MPARQHQRLPLLRLRIFRLRLCVRYGLSNAKYPICLQWRIANFLAFFAPFWHTGATL